MTMMTGLSKTPAADWKEIASTLQQTFCEALGDSDWDSYGNMDLSYMPKKVGYALYGPPEDASYDGYSVIKMKVIRNICQAIVEQDDHRLCERNSEIWMAIIFVCLAMETDEKNMQVVMEPVFRVPKYSNENREAVVFIDRNCRIYKNWKDYLQNNTLPSCSYCYPKNGIYLLNIFQEVELEFGKTPASNFTSKVWRRLDQLSPCVITCSIGLSAAGLTVPVSAPVITASLITSGIFSLYGVGRDMQRIIDRIKHKESIALTNGESRAHWISLAGNLAGVLSIGVTKMISRAAQGTKTLSTSEKIYLASLNIGTSAVNGANVGNEMLNVIEKVKKNEVTPLDITQLISSVIFFGHSVLNSKAAFKVITNQSEIMQKPRIRSDKFRKVFYNIKNKFGATPKSSKIVRSFNYFNDITESFLNTGIVVSGTFKPTEQLYNSHIIETVFQFKDTILNLAKKFVSSISNNFMQNSCRSSGQLFGNQNTHTKLSENPRPLGLAFSTIGGHIFKLLQELGEINIPMLLQIAEKICNDMNFSTGGSFCKVLSIIYMFIKNVVYDMDKMYQEEVDAQKKLLGADFCQVSFDKKYKISGKSSDFFPTVVLRAIQLVGDIFQTLKDACHKNCREAIDTEPVRTRVPVTMKEVTSSSFKEFNTQGQISKTEALQIATNLTKKNINLNNTIVAYSESEAFVLFEDSSGKLNIVKLECCVNEQTVETTVMC